MPRTDAQSHAARAWATKLPAPAAPDRLAALLPHPLLRPVERRAARALPAGRRAAEQARLEALIAHRQRGTPPGLRAPLYPTDAPLPMPSQEHPLLTAAQALKLQIRLDYASVDETVAWTGVRTLRLVQAILGGEALSPTATERLAYLDQQLSAALAAYTA